MRNNNLKEFIRKSSYLAKNKLISERISQNKEKLVFQMMNFFNASHDTKLIKELFQSDISFRIRSGDIDMLQIHGLRTYSITLRFFRYMFPLLYRFSASRLEMRVHPFLDGGHTTYSDSDLLKVRWSIYGDQTKVIMEGYSYFFFDTSTGLVMSHVIDRTVPPVIRKPILFWFLERSTSYRPC